MRRLLLASVALAGLLVWSARPAQAGVLGDGLAGLKGKWYTAVSKIQRLLPLPMPTLKLPCVKCGLPVPSFGRNHWLHKRTCVDPTRSPRDFFMLR